MDANKCRLPFLCVLCFVIFPTLRANIGHFDEYWKKQSEDAQLAARKAVHSNPQAVIKDFSEAVNGGNNNTRRLLQNKNKNKNKGPCSATNPIDSCWRCDPNWARNRKKLVNCVLGFGKGTTGGKDGKFYVVTDPSDNDLVNPKPGTLRHAVIQPVPLWITFARSMRIRLSEELMVTSNKTIDGRGANVHICDGAQITLQFVRNVIIHGLHVHDNKKGNGGMIRDSESHYGFRTQSDGDGISLFGATNVWIDHISMWHCYDGLIDAVMSSTAITISNCHFTKHNEVMLFGASDGYSGDKVMQVTLAFNHFGKGLVQRMPRCRWGFFHIVNNDYTHWLMYAIGGSKNPTIISQGNRFVAPANRNCKEVTKRDYATQSEWKNWNWRSEGDVLANGAFFVQSGKAVAIPKKEMTARPGSAVASLTRYAGSLNCLVNKAC